MVANPDREVRLAVYDNDKTIRTGHFESYVDPEDPSTPTLLLVFDTPLREGELKADLYAIVICREPSEIQTLESSLRTRPQPKPATVIQTQE